MAVFILGAGATRGASFVNPTQDPCLPPLDSDFFTQLQRVRNPKHQELISQVIADTIELFGINFQTTLETVFTTLEHTLRMIATTGENRDFKQTDLRQKRDRLLQAVAAVMEQSLTKKTAEGLGSLEVRPCKHHKKLVESILRPRDEIISFNYDCLIDYTLKDHGDNKWNAHFGYGFQLGSHGSNLEGDENWQPNDRCPRQETVKLYKLHGSLHFKVREGGKVKLKSRPYTKQIGQLKFTIIPPEYHKAYDEGVFRGLWSQAGLAIHRANSIVLIGYSLPPADLHSTALLRVSVKNDSLKSIVVVNPDKDARQRARSVLQRGITSKTRILVFDQLAEFAAADRELWD